MLNKNFCEYIKTQNSFKEILAKYKPQLIFLSGSRGVGTNIPTSDYDLVAITKKRNIKSLIGYEDIVVKNDKGCRAHCYVYSIDYVLSWLNNDTRFPKSIVSDLWFQNSIALQNKDNIILNNNQDLVDFWKIHSIQIATHCLNRLFTKHKTHQNKNTKFLCHCMLCLSLITNKDHQCSYIKQLKQQYQDGAIEPSMILELWKELEQQWNEYLIQQK